MHRAYWGRRRLFQTAFAAAALWPLGAAAAGPRVLMLGDSLTAGFGLAPEEALPAQIERILEGQGVALDMLNAGVSGDTTAGGRARLAWALAEKPTHAVVALGANDMLRGLPPVEARANLDAILRELKAKSIPTLLVGMQAAPNLGQDYVRRFNAIYPELAAKHGVAFYPFLLDGVAAQTALNQADGIHPNRAGTALIAERLAPHVRRLVAGT